MDGSHGTPFSKHVSRCHKLHHQRGDVAVTALDSSSVTIWKMGNMDGIGLLTH